MCLFSLASQRKKYTWMISQWSTKGKSKKLVPRFLSFKKPKNVTNLQEKQAK